MARQTSFRFTVAAAPAVDAVLARHAGAARFAYNQCLRAVKDALAAKGSDPTVKVPWSGFDLINHFNAWKRSEAAGRTFAVDGDGTVELTESGLWWRGEVCAQVFEEAAVDLGRGLEAYSKSKRGERKGRRVGFPTFRRKSRRRESFRVRSKLTKTGQPTIRVGDGGHPRSITLPVIGTVRVVEDTRRLRRLLRPDGDGVRRARIWFVTVSRHRGRWVLTVNVEAPDLHPGMRHQPRGPADHHGFVGVDRGLHAYTVAATAAGDAVARSDPPKVLARALPKLRRASKAASRKQDRSHNRRKADERLNRIHGRVADQRRHFVHQLSTGLVKTHDRLCVENLAVANMLANRRLARSIADSAWGEVHRQLAYKAGWYDAELAVAPRWFPSSKKCSACGRLNETLTLADRIFCCDPDEGGCGLVIDRDRNAATNLAAWAEAEHTSAAQAPDPQAGGRVTNACGGTSAGHRPPVVELDPQPRRTSERGRNPTRPPARRRERTPEKGAGEQPDRLFDRL